MMDGVQSSFEPRRDEAAVQLAKGSWATIAELRGSARMRLFCFPYAGGGPWIFNRWSDGLGPSFQICPIHLPGRGIRFLERAMRRVDEVAVAAARALAPQINAPFAVFGHSFGGLAAFEFVRELRRVGAPQPVAFVASACSAPQIQRARHGLHRLEEGDLLAALRHMGGTPEPILRDTEYMRMVLPTIRADFEALETYEYQDEPPLDCPITVFGGKDDRGMTIEQLAGWSDQTTAGFRLRILAGGHFFLSTHEADLMPLLAREFDAALSAAT